MSLTDTRIDQIADQLPKGLLDNIVAHLNPLRVILFGSRVTGESGPDSDWDIMIVVDDCTTQTDVNWRIMGNIRRGIQGAVDLIPLRESTF
jgi:predicted nucleotidyltransferase